MSLTIEERELTRREIRSVDRISRSLAPSMPIAFGLIAAAALLWIDGAQVSWMIVGILAFLIFAGAILTASEMALPRLHSTTRFGRVVSFEADAAWLWNYDPVDRSIVPIIILYRVEPDRFVLLSVYASDSRGSFERFDVEKGAVPDRIRATSCDGLWHFEAESTQLALRSRITPPAYFTSDLRGAHVVSLDELPANLHALVTKP